MRVLPSSPRARRRLGWVGLAAAVVAAAAATILSLPSRTPRHAAAPAAPATAPARPAAARSPARRAGLTAGERRAIDRTLDAFVPAALDRRDPGLAWDLSGPGLRGATTRADWIAGQMPVYPFPARGTRFHEWHPDAVTANRVSFDMLFQPRTKKLGAITYSIEVVRRGGRWVVNRWYPIATFTPVGQRPQVVGPNDFAAPANAGAAAEKGQLAPTWLLVPAGVVGALLAVAAWFAIRAWRRSRHGRQELARAGRTEMPSLPSTLRGESERPGG